AFASSGAGGTAYVLNTLGDSVSVVSVAADGALALEATIAVGAPDPLPLPVLEGRRLFAAARASTSGTFSCASCHPDAHVDQLLWFIGGRCLGTGCNQEEQ